MSCVCQFRVVLRGISPMIWRRSDLGELAFDYRWSTRYIFLDSWEALSHIERFRRKWKQQVIPFLAHHGRLAWESARAWSGECVPAALEHDEPGGLASCELDLDGRRKT